MDKIEEILMALEHKKEKLSLDKPDGVILRQMARNSGLEEAISLIRYVYKLDKEE